MARHLRGDITAEILAQVNRRHISAEKLDAANRDIINRFRRCTLPRCWGDEKRAAADGTQYDLAEENLVSERHIRYGGFGGIAYHHISDMYIALFLLTVNRNRTVWLFICADLYLLKLSEMLMVGFGGTIAFDPHHIQDDGVMDHAVNRRHRGHRILECIIMPLSLIVLLVEAILEAVLCLHLLNIPSRACLWLAGIR